MDLHFIIAGFSKCGTTSLHSLLSEHPEIFIAQAKDAGFLARPDYDKHWEEYESWFDDAPAGAIQGEASVIYGGSTDEEISRQRIMHHFPGIKLIFIARDPIDRIESSYREFHHSGTKYGTHCPFNLTEALQKFPAILNDSMYWTRINNYRRYLSESQILVMFLEDLKARSEIELSRCFEFLNVDPNVKITGKNRRLNEGSSKLYDSQQLRTMRRRKISRETSLLLAKIPFDIQNELFVQLGLRRKFASGPLEWDDTTLHEVLRKIGTDVHHFLNHYDKPLNFWPRFAQAYAMI